ncbi:MAG: alpha-xylosidase, partial [Duncaniella sp.]|nr:alpha-xylosidase [Duncaniella sp.]
MKPTNYHLFDFLDFDLDLKREESLWKACAPTAVESKDGDVHITVPFQKQVLANDMAADETAPRENHTLILRQYGPKILRVFMGFGEVTMSD